MSNNISRLHELGQSVWCDNLGRGMIESGELQRLMDLGIVGITSNPTIFMKSITGTAEYDAAFAALVRSGADLQGLYEGLVIRDISDAADMLAPVYESSNGVDGFVSLEVSPKLAYDAAGTVEEGKRLFATLNRPNVYIKVPATEEGIPAITELIAAGVNVNVTLIFALATYEKVMKAYIDGLTERSLAGGDLRKVNSVASFFVSRVDTEVDQQLMEKVKEEDVRKRLLGRAAIANARLAYERFRQVFDRNDAFGELEVLGAHPQRPLWASTSTKNPDYPDTLYVDELIAPDSVNTMPPATIEATLDHGRPDVRIFDRLNEAHALFDELRAVGIEINTVTESLRQKGVELFESSFDELMANLSAKRAGHSAAGK